MSVKNTLASVALAGSLALMGSACIVRAHGHATVGAPVVVVEEEPPPPRQVVVVEPRPGYVWIEGRWNRHGNRWEWSEGYWQPERVGYVWEQGRWERRGRGHVWVEGRWRAGGGAAVRDHRHEDNGRRGNDNNQGKGWNTRDHRH